MNRNKYPVTLRDVKPITVPVGERMIWLLVGFHTDDLDGKKRKGRIYPKHAWDQGKVRMVDNGAHKISNEAHNPEPFNSIVAGKRSLLSAMMKVLADYGVVLHLHRDSRKVITV
jgi:hypothetical protein